MNIRNIRIKHSKQLFFVFIFLFVSVGVAGLKPDSAYAYKGKYGGTEKAVKYCVTKRKYEDNKNALKASACKYGFDLGYQGKPQKCNTAYRKEFTGRYAAEVNVCAEGWTHGRSTKGSEASEQPSGGSGSGPASGATVDNSSAPGAGVNTPAKEEESKDGIADDIGASIIDGKVKLTGSDATNARIDNTSPDNIIAGILNVVYSVSAVIAVIVIVVAGIMYITSDGDAARVGKAKSAIIYSAVGLVIIGSAFIITGIIQNIGK